MTAPEPRSDNRFHSRVYLAVVIGFLLLSLGVAYLDEDAFISFRVVDNFVHGYGLRWNIDERVQVYTNPLWVLALIPLHGLFSGIGWASIGWASWTLSAVSSTAAVAIIAGRLRSQPMVLVGGFVAPLLCSQAFTDYTNSGLENPFLYLFIALFAERVSRDEAEVPWFALCVTAALCAATRLDSFLLFAPTLAWLWLRDLRRGRGLQLGPIVLGASPLLLWLAFSLFYYGTPFPNPKYAKLNGGIPLLEYLRLGGLYLGDMARNDVVTLLGLVAAVAGSLGLLRLPVWTRLLVVGAVLYCVYVVYVGGDFMAGRHWASPFFLSVSALALAVRDRAWARSPEALTVGVGVILAARFVVQPLTEQHLVIQTREQNRLAIVRNGGIRLQRFNCGYYEALIGSRGPLTAHSWSVEGLDDRAAAEQLHASDPTARYVVVNGNSGKTAYFAGPEVLYVDLLGIADALMARLPDRDGKLEMSGHLYRAVPLEYVEARRSGSLDGLDAHLRAWYAPMQQIISGPLFSGERLKAIWNMNTGAYDAELHAYIADMPNQAMYEEPKK